MPKAALAIATAVGAEFIRVNVYIAARLTDQGLIQGVAHRLLRYRKSIGSDVRILADVDVKHSVPLAPKELTDEVEDTVFRGCADGIIVTGTATGKRTAIEDLKRAVIVAKGHTSVGRQWSRRGERSGGAHGRRWTDCWHCIQARWCDYQSRRLRARS